MQENPANADLSAYLDGELPPEASARVERALSSDPALQAELEQLRLVRSMLSKHGRVEAPFGFKAKVLAAVADEPAPTSTWKTWLRRPFGIPVEGFAVALAALLVIVVVGSREQAPDGTIPNNFDAPPVVGDQVIVNPERDAARAQQRSGTPPPVDQPAVPEQSGDADGSVYGTLAGGSPLTRVSTATEGERVLTTEPAAVLSTAPMPTMAPEPQGYATPPLTTTPREAEPSGTADGDETPALFGASYRYQVSTSQPDASAQLRRLAGRYRGRVSDSTDDGSYRVQVPAEHLAEFGAALRGLGSVVERPDDRIFASSSVTIQVDLIQSNPKAPPTP